MTTVSRLTQVLAVVLVCGAAGVQAQSGGVGRVLLSVGEVHVERAGRQQPLVAGGMLENGDVIVTGKESNAQLRFSDESIVALKADTRFKIDSYNYNGRQDGSESAFFSLLKGGLRKITGFVGKLNQDKYRLTTTQATIGIRGTHYVLQVCEEGTECLDEQGRQAANGLYGAVYDSKIVASNEAGATEFGVDEYFHLADRRSPAIRLLAPPSFLRDQLDSRSKLSKTTSQPMEVRAKGGTDRGEQEENERRERLAAYLNRMREQKQHDKKPDFRYVDTVLQQEVLPRLIMLGSDEYVLELDRSDRSGVVASVDDAGRLLTFRNEAVTLNRGTAQVLDAGSDKDAGRLNWGRWAGPGSTITANFDGQIVNNHGGNLHYIYGEVARNLPTQGQATYSPVGGTSPTDSLGNTGTLISGGTINVDFTRAQLALNGLTVGFNGASYTMSGVADVRNGLFSTNNGLPTTVNCNGAACRNILAGHFAGFFAGPGGIGIGLDYNIFTRGATIEGVVGYRRR